MRATKYKSMWRVPLAQKYTNQIFESKDGTTSMKYLIRLKMQDFSSKDLLIKSDRNALRTYKGETPCRCSIMFDYRTQSNDWCAIWFDWILVRFFRLLDTPGARSVSFAYQTSFYTHCFFTHSRLLCRAWSISLEELILAKQYLICWKTNDRNWLERRKWHYAGNHTYRSSTI